MTTRILIFKIAAVVNAAALFSGYVWYRAGSARAEDPRPPEAEAQQSHRAVMMESSKKARVFDYDTTESQPYQPLNENSKRQMIMAGPKSDGVVFQVEPTDPPPSSDSSPPILAKAELGEHFVMDGSKSMAPVFGSKDWYKPQPAYPSEKEAERIRKMELEQLRKQSESWRANEGTALSKSLSEKPSSGDGLRKVIMSGSKSDAHMFHWTNSPPVDPEAPVREPDRQVGADWSAGLRWPAGGAQSPQSRTAAMQRYEQQLDRIHADSAKPLPNEPAPSPRVIPPAPPKRRVIMAGSKSAPADFDFDDPPAKRPVQQQAQTQHSK